MSRRTIALIAVPGVILALALVVYFMRPARDTAVPPSVAADSPASGSEPVPSVAALIADPSALQAATRACAEGSGADVMSICDRVHSARAQILAQKYRQGGSNKAAAP